MCARYQVPVIAYGAGTSIEGHIMAVEGGVTIDLSRMNRVIAVNGEDLTASVEAGVTRKQVNAPIDGTGLFFTVYPGADATLGGMAHPRVGLNAVRYGTMRENVLGRGHAADREVIHTARRARVLGRVRPPWIFVGAKGRSASSPSHGRLYPDPRPCRRSAFGRRGRGQHRHRTISGRPDRTGCSALTYRGQPLLRRG
jgi:D-lactate dehydrogenase (cytochrome)